MILYFFDKKNKKTQMIIIKRKTDFILFFVDGAGLPNYTLHFFDIQIGC